MRRLDACALAAVAAAAVAAPAQAVISPVQPADGSTVTTEVPLFVAVVATSDPFPLVEVSQAPQRAESGGFAQPLASCRVRTPFTATLEGGGQFSCTLAQPLTPGTYYWMIEYTTTSCATPGNCSTRTTDLGPFAFTVAADAKPPPPATPSIAHGQVSPAAPAAGGRLSVTAQLTAGGSALDVVSVHCTAIAGAVSLHATASRSGDTGRCRWTIPRSLRGRRLRGSITLQGPGGAAASYAFSVRVRP